MKCAEIQMSRHAFRRMFERRISPEAVYHVVREGEIVQSYPEDEPYPSWLLLGFWEGQPVHVVVARDEVTGNCWVVTVYRPGPDRWAEDFKTRKEP